MPMRRRGRVKDGRIAHHNEELRKELLSDPESTTGMTPKIFTLTKISSKSQVAGSPSNKSEWRTRNWLTDRLLTQALADETSDGVNEMVRSMLEKENHFREKMDEHLRQADHIALRQKEIQHKEWTHRVSKPLQKTIENYIDSQSSEDIEKRRRNLHEQYLKYCNKKGRAFMGDYDPSEYDPFSHQLDKSYLKVTTPPFSDPLLYPFQKRIEEERVVLRCETGRLYSAKEINELKLPKIPFDRRKVNSAEWLKAPVSYIESDVRQKSRQKMRGTHLKSNIDWKTEL
ncbi:protein FAM228B-like [Spea bombifrons]|uniref:protein FAM228B-like n=1 Tax=Spea bombifrons TaxID=233779 RepID=UPI002349639D|nr:protein FAM228B-like [Spea bombifrons]XP_053315865.1 protein FAM228B-like [Spea bombifrons]